MKIKIFCPNCGKSGSVVQEISGKSVRCPGCQTRFTVGEQESGSMPSLAPSRSFPPAIASAGSEIDHLISSLGESVETGPTEQIKPEISEPAPVEKNSGQFVSTVVTLVLVLLFVTAIVGAIAFEGSAQARSRGLLLMVLGAVSCCLMMGETNQFVKIRNGLFFFPLGFVLLLGGLFAIVTGELPAWLIDIMNGLLDRLKRAGR